MIHACELYRRLDDHKITNKCLSAEQQAHFILIFVAKFLSYEDIRGFVGHRC